MKKQSCKRIFSFVLSRNLNCNRGHTDIIRAMASRGPYVFSGAADYSIKVWDIKDKDMKNSRGCIATFTGHAGDVSKTTDYKIVFKPCFFF